MSHIVLDGLNCAVPKRNAPSHHKVYSATQSTLQLFYHNWKWCYATLCIFVHPVGLGSLDLLMSLVKLFRMSECCRYVEKKSALKLELFSFNT